MEKNKRKGKQDHLDMGNTIIKRFSEFKWAFVGIIILLASFTVYYVDIKLMPVYYTPFIPIEVLQYLSYISFPITIFISWYWIIWVLREKGGKSSDYFKGIGSLGMVPLIALTAILFYHTYSGEELLFINQMANLGEHGKALLIDGYRGSFGVATILIQLWVWCSKMIKGSTKVEQVLFNVFLVQTVVFLIIFHM